MFSRFSWFGAFQTYCVHSCTRFLFVVALFVLIVLHAPQSLGAAEVTLAWDPNPEPDIAGYTVYYGNYSRLYEWAIDVGNWTTCTVSGLENGNTYYISVTAYDTSGNESAYSGEIQYVPTGISADEKSSTTGGGGGGGCFIASATCGLR